MYSNCRYPYHSRAQELPHNETGSGAVRPSRLSREAGAAAPYAALQFLASGQGTTLAREQYRHGMDAVRQQLGNRAFMHWVGLLHAAGHDGQAQADAMQGRPDPAGSAPLQCMPKKRRQKEAAEKVTPEGQKETTPETGVPEVPGATPDTPPGAVAQAGVEAAVTQPQGEATGTAVAEAAVTQPQGEATGTAVAGEKKKKKKSRVQVALNTLRSEGVGAFKDYLEARFDETALLDTLAERVQRAQDLAGVREAALGAVQARQRALDPMAVADLPQACAPDPGQVVEDAVTAPVKTSPTVGDMALLDSCQRGDDTTFARLLRSGTADINMMTTNGTLLHIAAEENYQAIVQVLVLRPDIKVNLADSKGATPLFIAAQFGRLKIAGMLLQHADINPSIGTFEHGTTPLAIAAGHGQEKMVELLLSSGKVNVNLRDKNGATALLFAAQNNRPEIVDLLISNGADVNLPLSDGRTPLGFAVLNGYFKVVELLLQAPGVQINQRGMNNVTPLVLACSGQHKRIVRLLLNNGADPDMATRNGITPLHFACRTRNTKIAELLLNNKADPNIVDVKGWAAIHHTCVRGHTKILKMLLDAGADMDLKTHDEYTPYRMASAAGHHEVMKLLEARSRPAGPAAQRESLPREKQSEQATPTTSSTVLSPQPGAMSAGPAKDSVPTPETAPGSQAGVKEKRSPLEQAKREFRQDILMRLEDERIDSLDGIRLLEAVNEVADLDGLYGIYHRLAGIERKTMRTRSRP